MKFYRTEIQNALVAAAMAGVFPIVSYDPTTHVASTSYVSGDLLAVGSWVAPVAALANEINGSFEEARLQRRKYQLDRTNWTFQLKLEFNREVVLELFEDSLRVTPPRVLRDPTNGLTNQVTLRLIDVVPTHPIQQESSTGTKAVYRFEARITPQ